MDGLITQVGVGGIFALLVIEKVLTFLKNKNGKSESSGKNACIQTEIFRDHVQETHDMKEVIKRLDANVNTLTNVAVRQTTLLEVLSKNGEKK